MSEKSQVDKAKEAYYESLIKQALSQLMQREADDLLSNKELEGVIVPSKQYEKRMKNLFAWQNRKRKMRQTVSYIRKSAAVIFLVLGIVFAVLMFNPQVRAAVKDFIIEVFEQFTHINFTNDISDTGAAGWYPEWLPDGFELTRESQTNEMTRFIFRKEESKINLLYYLSGNFAYSADNEQIRHDSITIDDIEYFYGISVGNDKMNELLWENDGYKFVLDSDVDTVILFEVAKGIKKINLK